VTLVGDDSTDNTAALSALLSAGGTVDLAPGIYRYDPPILATVDDLTLDGHGLATLRSTHNKTDNVIDIRLIGSRNIVRGLTFDFVDRLDYEADLLTRAPGAHTLRIGGRSTGSPRLWGFGCIVSACVFKHARNTPIDVYYARNTVIRGNRIRGALGNGIFCTNPLGYLRIAGNDIEMTGDDGIFVADDGGGHSGTIGDVEIHGNRIDRTYAKGVGVSAGTKTLIHRNHISHTWTGGILVGQEPAMLAPSGVTIQENVLRHCGDNYGPGLFQQSVNATPYGIRVYGGASDVIVTGNTVFAPQTRGISVTVCPGISITKNVIHRANGPAISVGNPDAGDYDDVSDVVISDNEIVQAQSGISLGSATTSEVARNRIRSFDFGSAGETRGIFVGWVDDCFVHDNVMVNDDGADYGYRVRPGSTNIGLVAANNTETVA
jgi:hypothetical protein